MVIVAAGMDAALPSVVGGLVTASTLPGLAGTAFAAQDETKYFPLVLSPWLYADTDPQRTVLALSHSTSRSAPDALPSRTSWRSSRESAVASAGTRRLERWVPSS